MKPTNKDLRVTMANQLFQFSYSKDLLQACTACMRFGWTDRASTTAKDHLNTKTAKDPLNTKAAKDPLNIKTAKDPLNTKTAKDPLNTNTC